MVIRDTYQIVRKLGEGFTGTVYLADQILMDEQRALKFLSRQWSSDDAFTARFRREVQTLRQVRHKNVVDSGDLERAEDDSLFFAMEYCDGPDLRGFLSSARRPFEVKVALSITRAIALGLGAAHSRGMVHRDIKPENVLLKREGSVYVPKIADFGIVATKESSRKFGMTARPLLTPPYAAPEQWRGMRAAELDGRTDLYALGGVLFEMLTGQTAFDAESYEGWANEHANTAPRPPSELRPDLSNWRGLDAIVLRLLAKDREQRPRDVVELLSSLDAIQQEAFQPRRVTVREEARAVTVVEEREKELPKNPSGSHGLFGSAEQESTSGGRSAADARDSDSSGEPKSWLILLEDACNTFNGWIANQLTPWKIVGSGVVLLLAVIAGVAVASYIGDHRSVQSTSPTAQTSSAIQPQQGETLNGEPSNQPPGKLPPEPSITTVAGTVVDPTGTSMEGVKITISNPAKGFTSETTSDSAGNYKVTEVPGGTISVLARAPGFYSLKRGAISLKDGQVKHIKLVMSVGSSDMEVDINGR